MKGLVNKNLVTIVYDDFNNTKPTFKIITNYWPIPTAGCSLAMYLVAN